MNYTLKPLARSPVFAGVLSRSSTVRRDRRNSRYLNCPVEWYHDGPEFCCSFHFLDGARQRWWDLADEPGIAVAWAQLIFNLVMTVAVLTLLRIFRRRMELFDFGQTPAVASTVLH